MNPQKKSHALLKGGRVQILHCHCRKWKPGQQVHDVFLVLPRGEEAKKIDWAVYEWKDKLTGDMRRTVSKVRPPKRRKSPGPQPQPEDTKTYYTIGSEVEARIPSSRKRDKYAIVEARKFVSDARHLQLGVVAQYHKRFRRLNPV